ncbi:MAG: MAPEG family protein [Pseudomonadota bacterium]
MPEPVFTPALAAAALYAGLMGLLMIVLSVAVVRERLRAGVSIGDGGDARLASAIRAHANFSEYAPLVLLMIALAALAGAPAGAVHALGAGFAIGRVLHAVPFLKPGAPMFFRQAGMVLTYAAAALAALALIGHALGAM